MGCCMCAGTCNHIGNHSYCLAHGGKPYHTWTGTDLEQIPFYPSFSPSLNIRDELLKLLAIDDDFRHKVKVLLAIPVKSELPE